MWMDGMDGWVLIRRISVKAISNISKNLDNSTFKKPWINFSPKGLYKFVKNFELGFDPTPPFEQC